MDELQTRFWNKVKKTDGCWIWQAAKDTFGYGRISAGAPSRKILLAHRLSYEWSKGPIPAGMSILHTCDNPRCVNPAHLELGTQADNVRDMHQKQRRFVRLRKPDVLEIRKMLPKMLQREIAERYGITQTMVSRIALGKVWKSI